MRGPSIASAIFAVPLLLQGCASSGTHGNVAIEGRMLHSAETFSGSATAGIAKNSTVFVVSDKGVKCGGPYWQVVDDNTAEIRSQAGQSGIAKLSCDDGRTGSIYFQIGDYEAIGAGMLGHDIMTLTMK